MKNTLRRKCRDVRFTTSEEIRRGARGSSHPKASYQPPASHEHGGCARVAMVFSSYSLRILLVFPSYSLGILLLFFPCKPRGHTQPNRSFDSVGLTAIQTAWCSPINAPGAHFEAATGARLSPAAAAPATQRCSSLSTPNSLRTCCGWGPPRSGQVTKAKNGGGARIRQSASSPRVWTLHPV